MQSTLMIKDLPLDKELDGKKMSAVRGGAIFGSNVNAFNTNVADASGSKGGSGGLGIVVAPVIQNLTQVEVSTPTYFPVMPHPYY